MTWRFKRYLCNKVAGTICSGKERVLFLTSVMAQKTSCLELLYSSITVNCLNCLLKEPFFVILKCSNCLCGVNKGLVQLDAFLLLTNGVDSGLTTYQGNRSWKEYRIIFISCVEFEFNVLYWSSLLNKLENCVEFFYIQLELVHSVPEIC